MSRRRVIVGAAWSVPVIALATATPAFAASAEPAPPREAKPAIDNVSTWQADGRRVTGNMGVRLAYPAVTGVASVTLKLYHVGGGAAVETIEKGSFALTADGKQFTFTFDTKLTVDEQYYVVAIVSCTVTKWEDWQTTGTGSWPQDPLTATSGTVTIGNW